MDSPTSTGQWKMWRLSNADNLSDHIGEVVHFNWDNQKTVSYHAQGYGYNKTDWFGNWSEVIKKNHKEKEGCIDGKPYWPAQNLYQN
ncbi:MAG: hypothetical protein V3T17_00755 [Pseudomonadales bacterium]